MVYNTELLAFWIFSTARYSIKQKTRRFENIQFPKRRVFYFNLEYRTMEKFQKAN
jgi:hypothetical protein